VAAPVIYWAGSQWLETFTFRTPLGWTVFAAPLTLLMIITLITIAAVCARTAIETPVKALKAE
jgi:putative ABC transport system permease protein